MAKIKITQIRSAIGRTKRQKDTIQALGLRKLHHSVVKEKNDAIMGMIQKVNHLIKVEEV